MNENLPNSNELPVGWITTLLSEISEINMGQSPPSETYNNIGNGLPFFQGKAEFTELHPVVEKWCSQPNKIAETNDILLSVRAPVGTTNIANQRCCIGRGLAAIRYTPNHKFLFYYLRLIEKKLDEKGTGTTFKAISGEILRHININLPPLPEQHAIVSKIEQLFSELDKGIESLKTAQQQLKVYRQSVLKWAFNKSTGAESVPVVRLEQVCEFITKGTTPSKDKLYFQSGEIPFIKVYNLTFNGSLDFSIAPTFISKETHGGFLNRSKVIPGDVLMNIVGPPLGKVSIVPNIFSEWNINQAIVRFRCKEFLLKKYLAYYLLSATTINRYSKKAKATAGQFNLTLEICRDIKIPLPSVTEQHQIVQEIEARLSECDNMEATITTSLLQAEALRQSILKKAFEGKLLNERELEAVRQDPTWEPAERLLERIRSEKAGFHSEKKGRKSKSGVKCSLK